MCRRRVRIASRRSARARRGTARPIEAEGDRVMSKQKKSTKSASKKVSSKAKGTAPTKTDPDLVPLSQMDREKKAAKKEKKLSLLDAAAQVLKAKGEPMTCGAMVEAVMAKKLWTTSAPTP